VFHTSVPFLASRPASWLVQASPPRISSLTPRGVPSGHKAASVGTVLTAVMWR
jgi:hypothetical protein